MNEEDWNELLSYCRNDMLIPILGSELTTVKVAQPPIPLYQYLAEKVHEQVNYNKPYPYSNESLQQVCTSKVSRRVVRGTIISNYRALEERLDHSLAKEIMLMKCFNFFISASIDPAFGKILKEVRNEEEVEIYQNDLVADAKLNMRINKASIGLAYIYKAIEHEAEFATDDEEHMEFLYKLAKSKDNGVTANLLTCTEDKPLLFLGCSSPDWYLRFMIRILINKRLKGRETLVYVINDDNSQLNERYFYDNFKIKIVQPDLNIAQFVNQLKKRWQRAGGEFAPIHKGKKIFICYYRQDSQDVKNIDLDLKRAGYDTWIDDEDLKAGSIDQNIMNNIKMSHIFVPIISKNILNADSSFSKDKEWVWIREVIDWTDKASAPTIIPLILDSTSKEDARIPNLFKENLALHWDTERQQFLDRLHATLSSKS